jgi:solute carrier family 8 (sodium/calcium exchanger)
VLLLLLLFHSAPEILLAVVESILRLGRPAGELGPSTIVGSAAYNLLMIAAVCTASLPVGEHS